MRLALIGGTGLVGSLLAPLLHAAGHELHAVQRRPGGGRWREHVAPAEEWPPIVEGIAPEAAVSALGTTMRQAGSEAAFAAVDRDMVLAFARAARSAGARRMVSVSSVGADGASTDFYLRLKGEVDAELAGMGFDRLDLFRPGLLRGPRGADRRAGERIGILVSPLVNLALRGRLERYQAIDGAVVAKAIAATLAEATPGRFVHENRAIRRLAAQG